MPESPGERTKRRPTPLLLEALLSAYDSDEEYQARRLQSHALPPSTEVPVRRTFIEYGSASPQGGFQQAVSTAPACMGLSIGKLMDELCAEEDASPSTCSPSDAGRSSEDADWPVHGPAAAGEGPLPAVLYRMSPTSAKAAGYWNIESSARSNHSFQMQATASSHTQDDAAEVLAEVGSTASTSDDEGEGRRVLPEYTPDAKLPSLGSASHGLGQCKRCCFEPKGRCMNGENCQFCHFAHEKRKPKHKKKAKKSRRKRGSAASPTTPDDQVPTGEAEVGDGPCLFMHALIPTQVFVDANFPSATAVAVVSVPYVY